jgi:hypothetical protein
MGRDRAPFGAPHYGADREIPIVLKAAEIGALVRQRSDDTPSR